MHVYASLLWTSANQHFAPILHSCARPTLKQKPARLSGQKNNNMKEINRSLFNAQVSVFRSVKAKAPTATVHLWQMLCAIQSGKYRDRVEAVRNEPDKETRRMLKGQLPCFTVAGVFRGGKAQDLEAHTSFICIDLDEKDNEECANFAELKEVIGRCPNVAFCAHSVGGAGYFCLVPIADPAKHRAYFRALCADFKKCGLTVDRSGVDVGRKRLVSYDPEPYINTGAEVYDYTLPEKEHPRAQRLNQEVPEEARNPLLLAILEWADKKGADLTGDYGQWFEMLCALASTFGEGGREYAHRLSKNGPDYKKEDTDKQYDECLKHDGYAYRFGTLLLHARNGMGDEEYNRVWAASDFGDIIAND